MKTIKELKQNILEKIEDVESTIETEKRCNANKEIIAELEGKKKAFNYCIRRIDEFIEEKEG